MLKRYVYKNANDRPVNIGGYQFQEKQELDSDVLIEGFKEAVNNGFLELIERKPESAESDATQAPQTGGTGNSTGKMKVIFHGGFDAEGKEVILESEVDPDEPVKFPDVYLMKDETFEGWFQDAEFTKEVDVEKAKYPKEGEVHFYGKYGTQKEDDEILEGSDPDNSLEQEGGVDSESEQVQDQNPSDSDNDLEHADGDIDK